MHYQKFLNLSVPLLITGETGTGKSRLAKIIFNESSIYKEKFLTVHLASLKEDLMESELFGYKKGAFTGAVDGQNGYLKDTGNGTLFLDEIGELSLEAQKKLLYLLEEKKFTPVGSTQAQEFRGRIIMATNRNLEEMVKVGEFREDLFYRINVFKIQLSPITKNRNQLHRSIQILISELKTKYNKQELQLEAGLIDFLCGQEWKGNFRELKNTLEFVVALIEKPFLAQADFSFEKRVEANLKEDFFTGLPEDFNQSLEIFESQYLAAMLLKYGGKVNETARRLGISKTTLIHKTKKYRINTLKIRAEVSTFAA